MPKRPIRTIKLPGDNQKTENTFGTEITLHYYNSERRVTFCADKHRARSTECGNIPIFRLRKPLTNRDSCVNYKKGERKPENQVLSEDPDRLNLPYNVL